jgi:integrase
LRALVKVPVWLMDEIAASCPPEDRTADRRVFPGFTADAAKNAMNRACKAAGIAHFHPHDLRHRRITIWHHEGVPARALAERAGHSRASMSLDVYSHTLPPGEVAREELLARFA